MASHFKYLMVLVLFSQALTPSFGKDPLLDAFQTAVKKYKAGLKSYGAIDSATKGQLDNNIAIPMKEMIQNLNSRQRLLENAKAPGSVGIIRLPPEFFLQEAAKKESSIKRNKAEIIIAIEKIKRTPEVDNVLAEGFYFLDAVRRGHDPQSASVKAYIVQQTAATFGQSLWKLSEPERVAALQEAISRKSLLKLADAVAEARINLRELVYQQNHIADGVAHLFASAIELATGQPAHPEYLGPSGYGGTPKEYLDSMDEVYMPKMFSSMVLGRPPSQTENLESGYGGCNAFALLAHHP